MITVSTTSAALVCAALALALASCSDPVLPQGPRETTAAADPTSAAPTTPDPTPEPTDEPTTAESTEEPTTAAPAALDLSLAANPVFPEGTVPQIAEGFLGESTWTYSSPDDGQGHWGYTEDATGCTLDFYQNQLSPAAAAGADDTAATVTHLAELLGVTATDLQTNANAVTWASDSPIGNDVETLSVLQSSDVSTRFTMGRAFRSAGAGMAAVIVCPTNEQAVAVSAQVIAQASVLPY